MVYCVKKGQNMRVMFLYFKNVEVIPPRVEEPKLEPRAEAKGFPNPAPKGAWVPKTEREHKLYSSEAAVCVK